MIYKQQFLIDGELILTGVIELYEILLLIGSFILYRKIAQHRPAVILGLLEIFFIFDCTFQTEYLSQSDIGIVWTILWIAIFIMKLTALIRIFRLKIPVIAFIIPILAAICVAGAPYILRLSQGNTDKILLTHHLLTWYGVVLASVILWFSPAIGSDDNLDEWGKTVLNRTSNAAWMIWGGFYLYHLFAWIIFFNISIHLTHIVPYFVLLPFLPFFFKKEESTWLSLICAILISLAKPPFFWITALASGIVFGLKGWKNRQHRLYVGAILAIYFSLSTISWQKFPFPKPEIWLSSLMIVFLLIAGWFFRIISAFLIVFLGLVIFWNSVGTHSLIEWGILFIAIGFIALILGVFMNWKQSSHNNNDIKH